MSPVKWVSGLVALVVVGLLWAGGKLGLVFAYVVLVPVMWAMYFFLQVYAFFFVPQPSTQQLDNFQMQIEQLSWSTCRDINKHSVEFCEEEIRRLRKKVEGR
jgi:hypothetical protein